MYSQIDVKSKIKDYSIKFTSIDEVYKLIGEDYHLAVVDSNITKYFPKFELGDIIVVDTNEDLKSWRGLEKIFDEFAAKKVNTQTKLVVIGGGVLQDAVGFCASVYCRGIEYYLVPTTLLSQIDSCVGGKTSINYGLRKNILGTFYPPKEILVCEDWLCGLSKENFCSGLGELFKFDILRNKIQESKVVDLISGNENVLDHIYKSLSYKISILEIDEFDKKERKYLNFGHTFGHALEITSKYKLSHGYAVAIGCLIALRTSELYYNCNYKDYYVTLSIAKKLLENTISIKKKWFDYDALMECVKSDKKNTGCLNMVLIKDNNPVVQKIDDYSIIKEALENVYEALRLCN
jgi:3-dehydroquinate synthase